MLTKKRVFLGQLLVFFVTSHYSCYDEWWMNFSKPYLKPSKKRVICIWHWLIYLYTEKGKKWKCMWSADSKSECMYLWWHYFSPDNGNALRREPINPQQSSLPPACSSEALCCWVHALLGCCAAALLDCCCSTPEADKLGQQVHAQKNQSLCQMSREELPKTSTKSSPQQTELHQCCTNLNNQEVSSSLWPRP